MRLSVAYILHKMGMLATAAFLMVTLLESCTEKPENARMVDELPSIFPDYAGVTIPVGIAPLNFNIKGDAEAVYVEVRGSVSGELTAAGDYACFDIEGWHEMLEQNKGGELGITVSVEAEGEWTQYKPFTIYVSDMPMEAWGLTYRRIAPGYEVYGKMGIYQRELSTFEESIIYQTTQTPGACVNCHTSNKTNPDWFTFHVRGEHGATMVSIDGKREWLKAKNDSLKGSMVYPYWHPSGKYCAYSTNQTHQGFHTISSKRIEVFDESSDIFVYDPTNHELILDTLVMTKDHFETYPVFSPDGKTLYFCSAQAEPIPARLLEIRYNICKIDFDPEKGEFGDRVDTIFNAREMGKSAIHPRPSYDGKYLMFTMSNYGCFPIWHKEADNWLLDLSTGEAKPMKEANSNDVDSWHNWSKDSHWFVFTSRRDDGLHTRLYIAGIDEEGNVSKPFLLPQKNPWKYYDSLLDSYNTPDFTERKVDFDCRKAGIEILSDNRIVTTVR